MSSLSPSKGQSQRSPPVVPPRKKQQQRLPQGNLRPNDVIQNINPPYEYYSYHQEQLSPSKQQLRDEEPPGEYNNELAKSILDEEPETTIGETLQIRGKLHFERLLRINGTFQGELINQNGSLIIGPQGELIGDVLNMNEVISYGKIVGTVSVERLELCGPASVHGNITCKTLIMDPSVVVVGTLNVNPYAPQRIDKDGTIITEEENDKFPNSGETKRRGSESKKKKSSDPQQQVKRDSRDHVEQGNEEEQQEEASVRDGTES